MVTDRQTKSLIKAIEKYNADLAKYTATTGDSDLPYVDSTYCGFSTCHPYTYKVFKTRIKGTDTDGDSFTITDDFDLEEVKEGLKYDRRRLAKAWRIWKSDNPDWELEHDTDDEEE